MATTFIAYKDHKGFYIYESYIQLAFFYIYFELMKPGLYDDFSNKTDLVEDCEIKINGMTSTYFVLDWDFYLINPAEEQLMVTLLQNAKSNLQAKGAFISAQEIQDLPTTDDHWKNNIAGTFRVSELIRIFDALIEIMQGTWESINFEMVINPD